MAQDEENQPPQEQPRWEVSDRDRDAGEVSYNDLHGQSSLAYAGIIVSAIVLLVALVSDHKDHKYYEYGISVASIAMFLGLVGWIVALKTEGTENCVMLNNFILFCWCFIGACFMTFGGPFEETGNGYFGSWGLAIFATIALGANATILQSAAADRFGWDPTGGPTLGLFASSIILLVAIASNGIQKDDSDYAELVYSLVVTILSILMCVVMLMEGVYGVAGQFKLFVFMVFGVLWISAACLLTFRGPFLKTGNGYFGAWGGAVTSIFAINAQRRGIIAETVP